MSKKLKKPKFEVDKMWCSATNGKFKLVVYRNSSWTCKFVEASTSHLKLCGLDLLSNFWFLQIFFDISQKFWRCIILAKLSSQESSVGRAFDWYHRGCGFKSQQGKGFFWSKFEMQFMQLARQSIGMSPFVWGVLI